MDSNTERDVAPEPEAEGASYPATSVDPVAAELEAEAAESPEDDTVVELVVASFATDEQAEAAYNTLREAEKQGQLLTADLAIVEREENNRLKVRESQDVDARPGALLGGGIGAILGMAAGPLGLVVAAGAGALVGGVTAEMLDAGIDDDWLRSLGDALKPGGAIVAVAVARYWVPLVAGYLQQHGGEVSRHPLPERMASELQGS